MPDPAAPLALTGITVIEYGESVAVRFCGRLLATMGACVIRVPGKFAGSPPPIAEYLDGGKQSADIATETVAGRKLFTRLVEQTGNLIAGCRPSDLEALGVHTRSPELEQRQVVIAALSPWGNEGPEVMLEATDLLLFHGGGLGSITPRFANNPEQPPLRLGFPISEYLAGQNAAIAVLAGLNHRRETGQGSLADISGQQVIAHAFSMYAAYPMYAGRSVSRVSQPENAPFHFLPCRDGWVMIICPEQHQWQSFVDLMGNPEWADSPVFATPALRGENWDAIEPFIIEWMADWKQDDLYREAQARRIPLAPVNTMEKVLQSTHLKERAFFQDHTVDGKTVQMPGLPFKSSPPLAALPGDVPTSEPLPRVIADLLPEFPID